MEGGIILRKKANGTINKKIPAVRITAFFVLGIGILAILNIL